MAGLQSRSQHCAECRQVSSFGVSSVGSLQGVVTSVNVSVAYVGVIHTTAEAFAKCRADIRAYMRPFVNWSSSDRLVPDLSSEGCGRMTFDQTTFKLGSTVCQTA